MNQPIAIKSHTASPSNLYLLTLLVALAILLFSCANPAEVVKKTGITNVRVVMDNNYPPYAFENENGTMQGILVDQWKLWGKHTGTKVEIVGLPWDQSLLAMKNDRFDVIDTILYTKERAEFFDYTKPYADINARIFFPKNISGIGDDKSLQGFRVAVKTGDVNADHLKKHGIENLVYYNSYEEIVKSAANGNETFFVIDEDPGIYFLYKYNIQDKYNYSEPLYGGKFHRAVKKGNTDLLELINSGFASISASEYKQIRTHWMGTNKYENIERALPYLGSGIAAAAIAIVLLIIFNQTLQVRVKKRTQELEEAIINLKGSESRFREAIEFLHIPISISNSDGVVLEVNRQFEEHYGYTLEDIPTVSEWMKRAYPNEEYRKKVTAQWKKDAAEAAQNQKTTPAREYRVTGKNGKLHDVEIVMRAVDKLWVVSFTEVTERKQAEAALREAETKYRALIENAPEVIYLDKADEFSSNLYISGQVENLLGYSAMEFAKSPQLWHQLVHPADYQRALGSIHRTIKFNGAVDEYRMIKRDGNEIWVRDTSVPICDENGNTIFIQGFLQDITEQKIIEEKLFESEDLYRTLFEESPVALMEEDFSEIKTYIDYLKKNGVEDLKSHFEENPQDSQKCVDMVRIVKANKSAVIWYQAKHKSEVETRLSQLMNIEEKKNFFKEVLALLEGDGHYELSISRENTDGTPCHFILKGIVAPGNEDTWKRVLVSVLDITKRQQAEKDLARQLDLLRGLRTIDQAIISNFDLTSNLHILINEIITQLHVDATSISLIKEKNLIFAAGHGFKTDAQTFAKINSDGGLANRVAREQSNVHIINLQDIDYPAASMRIIKEEGFIAYYGIPLIVNDQLLGVLEIFHRSMLHNNQDWITFLETLAGQAAITISSAKLFNDLQISNIELQKAYDTTLEGWSRALDLRDEETEGHTRRVTELTLQLARKIGLSEEDLVHIKRGALLHDIGKMGIPDSVLLKPETLTKEEWIIMRKHPVYAYELLSPIKYLKPALDIPHHHHEWWNGMGYPDKLKGEQIPLAARIFAVADVWDALTSNRPYRMAWAEEKAKKYLREGSGKQFAPDIVEAFLLMVEEKNI